MLGLGTASGFWTWGPRGSGRGMRMKGIPAWVGSCCALSELRLGCQCLGYVSGGAAGNNLGGVAAGMGVRSSAAAAAAATAAAVSGQGMSVSLPNMQLVGTAAGVVGGQSSSSSTQ